MINKSVRVEKIINGGYGLARRQDGRIVLLRNSLPHETVLYTIDEERKNTLFGTVSSVVEAHPHRIAPPCPYYGDCGGCNLQHCSYEQQLQMKTAILEDLFRGLQIPPPPLPRPSPDRFGYRQRIRLQVEGGKIGYYRSRSADIVPIRSCLIAHTIINGVLEALLQNDFFLRLCRHSRAAELHLDPVGGVALMLHHQRPPRPKDRHTACQLVATSPGLERVFFKGEAFALAGPFTADGEDPAAGRLFSLDLGDSAGGAASTLSWEIDGFSQVNIGQNRNLVDHVLGLCTEAQNQSLLDLYCGMGNFSVPLAGRFDSVVGVEAQNAAIRSARRNSLAAGLDNTVFIKGAGEKVCRRLLREKEQFDTVLLDPPRQGIPDLAAVVAGLSRRRIIYISCDPATLARDIFKLCSHGLGVVSLQPFDMFPQTHHIETVAVLEKN